MIHYQKQQQSLSIKMSSSESSFPAGQVATCSLQLGNLCQVPQPNVGSKDEPHLMYREPLNTFG